MLGPFFRPLSSLSFGIIRYVLHVIRIDLQPSFLALCRFHELILTIKEKKHFRGPFISKKGLMGIMFWYAGSILEKKCRERILSLKFRFDVFMGPLRRAKSSVLLIETSFFASRSRGKIRF